jgi:hypothetical protein
MRWVGQPAMGKCIRREQVTKLIVDLRVGHASKQRQHRATRQRQKPNESYRQALSSRHSAERALYGAKPG